MTAPVLTEAAQMLVVSSLVLSATWLPKSRATLLLEAAVPTYQTQAHTGELKANL